MPPKKKDDLLAQLQAAADAEAAVEPPDFVDVDGVRFWRTPQVAGPRKPDKAGFEYVTINVAPHARDITLDGVKYFHGFTYEVEAARVPTFLEIMHNTWRHERATGGANINAGGYAPQGRHIDGQGGVHMGSRA